MEKYFSLVVDTFFSCCRMFLFRKTYLSYVNSQYAMQAVTFPTLQLHKYEARHVRKCRNRSWKSNKEHQGLTLIEKLGCDSPLSFGLRWKLLTRGYDNVANLINIPSIISLSDSQSLHSRLHFSYTRLDEAQSSISHELNKRRKRKLFCNAIINKNLPDTNF